jgi:hypothetical protein
VQRKTLLTVMDANILALLLVAGGIALLAGLWLGIRRSTARRRPTGGVAWALLFLSSGRMPPPPPQAQIEAEANERRNREIERSKNS